LKEPLGTLLLFCFATGLIFRKNYRGQWNDEIFIILPMIVFLLLLCSQDGFSIHPRYLLPFLPFFYLFISRVGKGFVLKQHSIRIITSACLLWIVGSSLWYYPCSMAYFNEIIPVQKRPEILLGSNIDWGQNAYFLKSYLEKHPEVSPVKIVYSCPEDISRLGIKTEGEPPYQPEPGWYALGVNDIYASSGDYAWLKKFNPNKIIAYSIYVYHITQDDIDSIKPVLPNNSE
jgi:hypothetical protein